MTRIKRKSALEIWTLAARPKTLWAAVAPVVVGTALAVDAGGFHWLSAVFALLGAVLIQIGTNYSNDYFDFLKGADTSERQGPLRVTQAGLATPRQTMSATVIVFSLALVTGFYLIARGGWPILVIGLLSILFGVLYTAGRYSLADLGLADLFVLIFFGPVAVGGTYFVQVLDINTTVIVCGLAPGLLSMAILLVNNIRDIDQDRQTGKRTLIVRWGRPFGVGLYATCILVAMSIPLGIYILTGTHPWSIFTFALIIPAVPIIKTLIGTEEAQALNPLLGETSRLLLIYSLIFSLTWNI